MGAEAWHFECKGKQRKGDKPGSATLHVWRLSDQGLGYCVKCGIVLTLLETYNCFRSH